MNLLWSVILSVVGLALLTYSADRFVDGAVALSKRLQVSAVLIGAVVIGLGTSVPEMLVSVLAAADDNAALGVGNIVGSNIANLSLVLGVSALVLPLAVSRGTIWREAPLSFAAVALFGYLLHDGLTLVDAAVLLVALAAAMTAIVVSAREDVSHHPELAEHEIPPLHHAPTHRIGLVTFLGLVGTAVGAQMLIRGALGLADAAGLSEGFVGVSLVAVGTSLPELVTGIQAARQREHDLVIGNVLGSNIFNSLAVGGAIALFSPGDIGDPKLTGIGTVMMIAISAGTWLLMWIGHRIVRIEALLLVVAFGVTMALLA
jgi:cation:H+ antiporter